MGERNSYCRECRFFYSPSPSTISPNARRYECRRRAPVHEAQSAHAHWPMIVGDPTDWCGEFEPNHTGTG
ncbi:MAG TPA: hypothetical protein VMT50_06930 [Steroidobacteraceae bacterium]|nr:hypothetical protein [Steroidobacteraceae bacterium]